MSSSIEGYKTEGNLTLIDNEKMRSLIKDEDIKLLKVENKVNHTMLLAKSYKSYISM